VGAAQGSVRSEEKSKKPRDENARPARAAPRGYVRPDPGAGLGNRRGRVRRLLRSDHYLGIDPDDAGYRPTDSWTTLACLAVQTERVRLGTLMTASNYRLPGPLAVAVTTVDAMSGGRAELRVAGADTVYFHVLSGVSTRLCPSWMLESN
jgi:hypothetical protein